jgi:hypothetical protein
MKSKKTVLRRSSRRIFFKNKDMDFYLMCIMANERREGASHGKAMLAASRIQNSDPKSWSQRISTAGVARRQLSVATML